MTRAILRLVRRILAEQEEGSDYDALYFGMQDVEMMLEDMPEYRRKMSPQETTWYTGGSGRRYEKLKKPKKKRKGKMSGWNRFVQKNSKKKMYQYANGKIKLKKLGIAWRKTAEYKRSKRRK